MTGNTKETLLFWLAILSGVSSIAGFFVALSSDQSKVVIVLIAIIVFLVALLLSVWYAIHKIVHKEFDREYIKLSFFTKCEYINQNHIIYDGYRLIQSKRAFLPSIKWAFKWSGSKQPIISSTLQDCDGKIIENTSNDYDHVVLKFKKALSYNESAVVHFHANMDDVDNTAQPYLDVKIEEPISVVDFRVILAYKDDHFSERAQFMRKPINSGIPTDYQILETVSFNSYSKSYEYVLTNPEVGYFYRLQWVK